MYDQSEPDLSLEVGRSAPRVRVITNTRTPGLAGARNTGILDATGDLVAFCDDDDEWLPGKLAAQVEALRRRAGRRVRVLRDPGQLRRPYGRPGARPAGASRSPRCCATGSPNCTRRRS